MSKLKSVFISQNIQRFVVTFTDECVKTIEINYNMVQITAIRYKPDPQKRKLIVVLKFSDYDGLFTCDVTDIKECKNPKGWVNFFYGLLKDYYGNCALSIECLDTETPKFIPSPKKHDGLMLQDLLNH